MTGVCQLCTHVCTTHPWCMFQWGGDIPWDLEPNRHVFGARAWSSEISVEMIFQGKRKARNNWFEVSFLVFPGQGWFRSVHPNAGIWKSLGSVKNHVIAISGVSCVWAALDFVERKPFQTPEGREVVGCDQLWPWQIPWRKNFSLFTFCKLIFPASILKCSLRQNHCLKPIAKVSQDHTAGLSKGSGLEPHVFFQGSQVARQANIYRGFFLFCFFKNHCCYN